MQQAAIQQRLDDDRDAADLEHVERHIFSAGLQIGDIGRAAHDFGDVLHGEADPRLMRDRRQMQGGVGGTAGGAHDHRRVFQRLQRDDVARADVLFQQVHHRAAGFHGPAVAILIGGRGAGGMGQREPDRLGHRRHGVGGELAATGAGRRAGDAFDIVQFFVGDLARAVLAHRFEHVHHRQVAAFVAAGQDGAAIHEHAGHVQPHHGHHHAGQGLVAAGEADQRIVAMAAHGQLDGIGDQVARDQRGLHALMAHGDAVGDGDGGELTRRAERLLHTALDRLGLAREGDIAGGGLVPACGHADEGLVDLLLGQPHGVIIAAMRRAIRPHGHVARRQARLVPMF